MLFVHIFKIRRTLKELSMNSEYPTIYLFLKINCLLNILNIFITLLPIILQSLFSLFKFENRLNLLILYQTNFKQAIYDAIENLSKNVVRNGTYSSTILYSISFQGITSFCISNMLCFFHTINFSIKIASLSIKEIL